MLNNDKLEGRPAKVCKCPFIKRRYVQNYAIYLLFFHPRKELQ